MNYESLQKTPLPTVILTEPIDISQFNQIVLCTKVLRPLFPSTICPTTTISEFQVTIPPQPTAIKKAHGSSYGDEDYEQESLSDKKPEEITVSFQVEKFKDILFICIEENFLHVSPIAWNLLSQQIIRLCKSKNTLQTIVLGTSDRITTLKSVGSTLGLPDLEPPEFVTNCTASLITTLILHDLPFKSLIAPSEGPSGFEKLSLVSMDQLAESCFELVKPVENVSSYIEECHRAWRLQGTAMGAQTGLYI